MDYSSFLIIAMIMVDYPWLKSNEMESQEKAMINDEMPRALWACSEVQPV